jgi:hypothetical protein
MKGIRIVFACSILTSIDAFTRVDVDPGTEPAPGNGKTDVTCNVGVGVKF